MVNHIATKCKYHQRLGQTYPSSQWVPAGLCHSLFYAAYADCLSVLYHGKPVRGWLRTKGKAVATAHCPFPEGVRVQVRAEDILPSFLQAGKELLQEAGRFLGKSFDAPGRRVLLEIEESGKACPFRYETGDLFRFNLGNRNELCPAGFAAGYPYAWWGRRGDGNASFAVHCPDHVGVTYGMNLREAGAGPDAPPAAGGFPALCRMERDLKPQFRYSPRAGGEGTEGAGHGQGEASFGREAVLPERLCLLLFHSIYAYGATFLAGGWFDWVNHGEQVIVHCPAPSGVAVQIRPPAGPDAPGFEVRVIRSGSDCPRHYREGETMGLDATAPNALRMKMVEAAFPFILSQGGDGEGDVILATGGPHVQGNGPLRFRFSHG